MKKIIIVVFLSSGIFILNSCGEESKAKNTAISYIKKNYNCIKGMDVSRYKCENYNCIKGMDVSRYKCDGNAGCVVEVIVDRFYTEGIKKLTRCNRNRKPALLRFLIETNMDGEYIVNTKILPKTS